MDFWRFLVIFAYGALRRPAERFGIDFGGFGGGFGSISEGFLEDFW